LVAGSQVLEFEQQYLDSLPTGQMYERSYMHRDTVTHVMVRGVAARVAAGSAKQKS
jgi:peptidylprolyl isomerase domain and WD repeat-containing protein 1